MSKRNLDSQILEFNGIELKASFTVSGKYYPQTHEQPAEFPEVEIQEITVADSDVNIYELFNESQLDELHETLNSFITY